MNFAKRSADGGSAAKGSNRFWPDDRFANRLLHGEEWWARQGLNLRPLPCEGSALPLSYAPAARRAAAEGAAQELTAVRQAAI